MAYINAEEVKAIRKALKDKFPKHKFSVTKGNGGHSVDVAVMEGPAFYKEEDQYKHYHDEYTALDLNKAHTQINHYWLKDHYLNNAKFFQQVVEIMKTAPYYAGVGDLWFDESDIQTDYFHTAYYLHVAIGKWNKPFKVQEAA